MQPTILINVLVVLPFVLFTSSTYVVELARGKGYHGTLGLLIELDQLELNSFGLKRSDQFNLSLNWAEVGTKI